MWESFIYALLVGEGLILAGFIYEWASKKKKNNAVLFLAFTFVVNLALYLIPYLHDTKGVGLLGVLGCMSNAIKAFVGEWEPDKVSAFAAAFPLFGWAYVFGTLLAPLATVYVAVQAFSFTFRNRIKVFFALRRKSCDIVLGTGENALRYAKDGAAVLLPEPQLDRDAAQRLVERGYIVLRRSFTKELLAGRLLTRTTAYNIICPGTTEENLEHINTFIAYHKAYPKHKKLQLFVEVEAEKSNVIRQEIIDKSCCRSSIFTFCSNELLSRRFAEEHPITEHLPRTFIEADTSIKNNAVIGVIYLGFGPLNQAMYAQSVFNDQLTAFRDGEYTQKPLDYHLFDLNIDRKAWLIDGLKEKLEGLATTPEQYYPLPPMPYTVTVHNCSPCSEQAIAEACALLHQKDAFYYVVVDTGDMYKNIETGTQLRSLMGNVDSYHVFIRSETVYIEDDAQITYLGDFDDIFTHSTIVNDELSRMAEKVNEVYAIRRELHRKTGNRAEIVKEAREAAKREWAGMPRFRRQSNLYAALNLRLKLHLLGLDYTKKAGPGVQLESIYPTEHPNHVYADYFGQSLRNAMLAQEKYRWNVYHLAKGVLPMPKAEVKAVFKEKTGEFEMYTKNEPLTRHACLTTYNGLDTLSKELCEKMSAATGTEHRIEEFDYYHYDDQLLAATTDLMAELNCTLIRKPNPTTEQ